MSDNSISLNKFISSTGFCSRRKADEWIETGRVKINGKVAKKGNRVLPTDKVSIDDEPFGQSKKAKRQKKVYLVLHKPKGVTCTTDLKDKDNIISYISHKKRIFPIGRLDKDSTGLILLTNDGDIVNKILRSENNHEKEYVVAVNKNITGAFIAKMGDGVRIMGKRTKKCKVRKKGSKTFSITLTEGMNRQIRRMCNALEYKVVSLKRVRVMNIKIQHLPLGVWRELTNEEITTMKNMIA